jgi:hypothetical protein
MIIYLNKLLFMLSVEYEYTLETFNSIWPKNTLETYRATVEIRNMYIMSYLDFRCASFRSLL